MKSEELVGVAEMSILDLDGMVEYRSVILPAAPYMVFFLHMFLGEVWDGLVYEGLLGLGSRAGLGWSGVT